MQTDDSIRHVGAPHMTMVKRINDIAKVQSSQTTLVPMAAIISQSHDSINQEKDLS